MIKKIALVMVIALFFFSCSGNSSNVDSLIKEYSNLVEETVELQEKIMAGDEKAISEAEKLSSKAASLYQKIEKADLTPAQSQRFLKAAAEALNF